MKVLFVASFNKGYYAPFIVEQADALSTIGCQIEFFGITGKGFKGYMNALPELKRKIKSFHPDIIHSHYGLSGLLACLQRKVPVVTTFHGSDINEPDVLKFSKLAIKFSKFSIFVSQKSIDIAKPTKNFTLIPCGIDLTEDQMMEKTKARDIMGLNQDQKYVLFAGAFNNAVKNYPLAKSAMELIHEAELIELKGYTRQQVTILMCASDAILMTSFTEGSPQVIKEAMACGCPVVSVDVGDVKGLTSGIEGCYVVERKPDAIANCLKIAVAFGKTNGRQRIISRNLDNRTIAGKIMGVYNSVL